MPCLEVTLPAVDDATRQLLAEQLTDTFVAATGFEREHFGILFHEYALGQSSMNGELWNGHNPPLLHLMFFCPVFSVAVKDSLVKNLSAVFTKILKQPDWLPIIHFSEHSYKSIGWRGALLSELIGSDRKKT